PDRSAGNRFASCAHRKKRGRRTRHRGRGARGRRSRGRGGAAGPSAWRDVNARAAERVAGIGPRRGTGSENGQRPERRMGISSAMDGRRTTAGTSTAGLYHGWLIVAVAFLVALFGFGLGFYGPGIYLVALRARFGWSAADIAVAITVYYVLGATLLFFFVGPAFDRCGVRCVSTVGALALAPGVAALTLVSELWPVHAALPMMSVGS